MIEQGNQVLKTLGYTEHSKKHALKVAEVCSWDFKNHWSRRTSDWAGTNCRLHARYWKLYQSTGSCPQWGYFWPIPFLKELDMPLSDRLTIWQQWSSWWEDRNSPRSSFGCTHFLLIRPMCEEIVYKTQSLQIFDIHDRVNYAALSSSLEFKTEKKIIQMNLELDDSMCRLWITLAYS